LMIANSSDPAVQLGIQIASQQRIRQLVGDAISKTVIGETKGNA